MRRDGSLGGCTVGACPRDAAYASTGECTKHYKRRMAQRLRQWCSQCHLRKATYVAEGLCQACRAKRIAGYGSEVCKEESCTKPLYAKAPLRGWCRQHWEAELRSTSDTRYKPHRKPQKGFQASQVPGTHSGC